jgi:acyl carrier protein
VSDEATWYDFDYLEAVELAAIVESHYGVAIEEATLALPSWKLLDFLAAKRTQPQG